VSVLLLLLAAHPAHAASRARLVITNVQVSHDSFLAHSEPSVAENPRDPNNLIAASKMFTDPAHYQFKIGIYYSTNGGRTWHDSGPLPGFDNYSLTSDVSIAFAPNGAAYVAVLACGPCLNGANSVSGIFVSRSTDGGKTFSDPIQVFLDDTGATFSDKPWIAVDGTNGPTRGNVYVAWNLDPTSGDSTCADPDAVAPRAETRDPPSVQGGIVVARSTNGGHSFSKPVMVDPFTQTHSAIGAIPAVSPDGHVSVVYASVSCTSGLVGKIDIATSSDGGKSFSAPQAVASHVRPMPGHLKNGTFRNITMPAFGISPKDGAMVVAWADMRYGDADILARRSTDGGKTWSSVTRVNDDRVGNGKDQFQPALAVAPNGSFTCAWFDRRYDPENRLIDEEIAQSQNDGLSFGRNIRVTRISWDPAVDAPEPEGRSGNTFIGDYQGLAADNRTVHPLWNDTQNGRSQEIQTAVMSVRLFRQ
jgi:hypothetical protein